MEKLVINVVTWNSARFLPSLFESLDAQTSDAFSVQVVDNASADGTQSWLEERSDIPTLRNFRNQGFARAHNQAIALALSRWQSDGDLDRRYIMVLNPDTMLEATCVAQIISYMDTHPDIAIAAPKLLRAIRKTDEDGEEVDVERTNSIDSMGIVLTKRRRVHERGAGEEDTGRYDQEPPFGVSGAAMVIRASAIATLRIGDEIFDEDFFAYKEDIDLCWRARLLGLKVACIPNARVWHHRTAQAAGGSVSVAGLWKNHRSHNPNVVRLSRRNQAWLEWKNDDAVNRFIHLPWLLVEWVIRAGGFVLFSKHRKGVIEAWLGRGRMHAKHKELLKRRKASPLDMRAWFV